LRFKIKRRLAYLGIGAAAFLAVYSGGAAFPLTEEESAMVREQFAELVEDIDQYGIFLNNFWISMVMFVPGLGAAFGAFVGFQTGIAYSAIVDVTPELAIVPPQTIFLIPHGAMELFVYGMAMSRSGILMYRLAKDKPWRPGQGRPFYHASLVPTFIEMGIAAGVLFAAALVEWAFIEMFGGIDTASLMPT
jgi:hypothetical protein